MEQGKRRNSYTPEFKAQAVERMRAGGPVSALARELGVRRKFLYEWKHALEEGCGFPGSGHALNPARPPGGSGPAAAQDGAGPIKELEALVGRLTLENHFFKAALQSIEELRRARGASSSVASSPKSKR